MFAPRYFAPRYFAPRYWPPGIIIAGPAPAARQIRHGLVHMSTLYVTDDGVLRPRTLTEVDAYQPGCCGISSFYVDAAGTLRGIRPGIDRIPAPQFPFLSSDSAVLRLQEPGMSYTACGGLFWPRFVRLHLPASFTIPGWGPGPLSGRPFAGPYYRSQVVFAPEVTDRADIVVRDYYDLEFSCHRDSVTNPRVDYRIPSSACQNGWSPTPTLRFEFTNITDTSVAVTVWMSLILIYYRESVEWDQGYCRGDVSLYWEVFRPVIHPWSQICDADGIIDVTAITIGAIPVHRHYLDDELFTYVAFPVECAPVLGATPWDGSAYTPDIDNIGHLIYANMDMNASVLTRDAMIAIV